MNASHELRNPLGALLLRVEFLATGLDDSWASDVDKTREEGQRMARILDALLTMARTQRRDAALEQVDLADVARDRAEAWRDAAGARGVTLTVHAEPAATLTDRTSIESALDGVIDNAVKFAPSGSTVEVRAAREDGAGLALSVRDYGPGLTDDEIGHVTERFWRSTRDQNVAGSGLGLAIANDLLHALGGSVTVTSPAGGGLKVTLLLPDAAQDGPASRETTKAGQL